jgi:hypothetical protein
MLSMSSNSRLKAASNSASGGNMLCASLSTKRCPSDRRSLLSVSVFSSRSITSPRMLSAPTAPSPAGMKLRTLAPSSASLALCELRFAPRKLRCLVTSDDAESSRDSLPKASPLLSESWVVAFETSCGLEGALRIERVEYDVDGRAWRTLGRGRGGSGGGVPSRDGGERALVEALRERLCMMFSVGFAKSCCSTLSTLLDVTLLLCCGGVAGVAPPGSALPVSGI